MDNYTKQLLSEINMSDIDIKHMITPIEIDESLMNLVKPNKITEENWWTWDSGEDDIDNVNETKDITDKYLEKVDINQFIDNIDISN